MGLRKTSGILAKNNSWPISSDVDFSNDQELLESTALDNNGIIIIELKTIRGSSVQKNYWVKSVINPSNPTQKYDINKNEALYQYAAPCPPFCDDSNSML